MPAPQPLRPLLAAAAGIALYSVMDAAMKGAVLAVGALVAVFWRHALGTGLSGALWLVGRRNWPTAAAWRLHGARGLVVAVMSVLFFFGLGRLPMADAIALSFVAPVLALLLAAWLLGERVRPAAWAACALALVGVLVILGGKVGRGRMGEDTALGVAAVIGSAALFAYNLILARRQAQAAGPIEIAFAMGLVVTAALGAMLAGVWALDGGVSWPGASITRGAWPLLGGAALLGTASLLALSWAYGRAEASALIPMEYTSFAWAVVCGWLFFGERLTVTTGLGAALVVAGAALASRSAGPGVAPPAVADG